MTNDDEKDRPPQFPIGRSAREEQEYRKYFQESGVPYNLQGITDKKQYDAFEKRMVQERDLTRPRMTKFTYAEFKDQHRHLFQNVWSWAGTPRTYTTGRDSAPFAAPEYIESWMEQQFSDLHKDGLLKGLPKEKFVERAAHYVNEINACHPFVEGNGRLTRAFLADLCHHNNYRLDQTRLTKDQWYEASRQGFHGNNKPFEQAISEALDSSREKSDSMQRAMDKAREIEQNRRDREDNSRGR